MVKKQLEERIEHRSLCAVFDQEERIQFMSENTPRENWFNRSSTGSALAILSGLSFLFLCMVLPLVGRAGMSAPHAEKNFLTFLAVLLVSLALSLAATVSKFSRGKIDGSPAPKWSIGLSGLLGILLLCLFTGLLGI